MVIGSLDAMESGSGGVASVLPAPTLPSSLREKGRENLKDKKLLDVQNIIAKNMKHFLHLFLKYLYAEQKSY